MTSFLAMPMQDRVYGHRMKMLLTRCAATLMICLLSGRLSTVGAAEDDNSAWDRYALGSIAEIVDGQTALVCAGVGSERPVWTMPSEDHARRAVLTYTGLSRPISALRGKMLSNWLKSLGISQKNAEIFQREYLFQEDDSAYWMPVQDSVAAYFSDELKPNAPVLLYLIWAGAHCTSDRVTWLFLVNEFEALEAIPTEPRPSVT